MSFAPLGRRLSGGFFCRRRRPPVNAIFAAQRFQMRPVPEEVGQVFNLSETGYEAVLRETDRPPNAHHTSKASSTPEFFAPPSPKVPSANDWAMTVTPLSVTVKPRAMSSSRS